MTTPAEGFGDRANSDAGDDAAHGRDEDIKALGDILSDAVISNAGSDVIVPINKKGKSKRRKPRDTKYQKLLSFPNIHAGLHLAENAREYATVMNSNVLAGELKHK